MRPLRERAWSATVIIDASPSMPMWRARVRDVVRLLLQLGAFSAIKWMHLDADGVLRHGGPPASRLGVPNARALSRRYQQLALVLTDGLDPRWVDGRAAKALGPIAARAQMSIMALLPARLWSRTHLGRQTTAVRLRSARVEQLPDPFEQAEPTLTATIVDVDTSALRSWARFHARGTGTWPLGVSLDLEPISVRASPPLADAAERFRSSASPLARRLAALLSLAPRVELPLARAVRQACLPGAGFAEEAEVLLGGILRVADTDTARPDSVLLEMIPRARELLSPEVRQSDVPLLFEALIPWLRQQPDVPEGLVALLVDPEPTAEISLDPDNPLCSAFLRAMRSVGGRWATAAEHAAPTMGPEEQVAWKDHAARWLSQWRENNENTSVERPVLTPSQARAVWHRWKGELPELGARPSLPDVYFVMEVATQTNCDRERLAGWVLRCVRALENPEDALALPDPFGTIQAATIDARRRSASPVEKAVAWLTWRSGTAVGHANGVRVSDRYVASAGAAIVALQRGTRVEADFGGVRVELEVDLPNTVGGWTLLRGEMPDGVPVLPIQTHLPRDVKGGSGVARDGSRAPLHFAVQVDDSFSYCRISRVLPGHCLGAVVGNGTATVSRLVSEVASDRRVRLVGLEDLKIVLQQPDSALAASLLIELAAEIAPYSSQWMERLGLRDLDARLVGPSWSATEKALTRVEIVRRTHGAATAVQTADLVRTDHEVPASFRSLEKFSDETVRTATWAITLPDAPAAEERRRWAALAAEEPWGRLAQVVHETLVYRDERPEPTFARGASPIERALAYVERFRNHGTVEILLRELDGRVDERGAVLLREIRTALSATLRREQPQGSVWVTVAGNAGMRLPPEQLEAARALGRALAEQHCGLITGAFSGVDHVTAREFRERLGAPSRTVRQRLLSVVVRGRAPDFDWGRRVEVVDNKDEFWESATRGAAVIVIGSAYGTRELALAAGRAGRRVFAYPGTGAEDLPGAIPVLSGETGAVLVAGEVVRRAVAEASSPTSEVARWAGPDLVGLATEYLRPDPGGRSDILAARIRSSLNRRAAQVRNLDLSVAIRSDRPPERVIAYIAMQVASDTRLVTPAVEAIERELPFAAEYFETRPLWLSLIAMRGVVRRVEDKGGIAARLQVALRTLESMPHVDKGGQCKQVLREVLADLDQGEEEEWSPTNLAPTPASANTSLPPVTDPSDENRGRFGGTSINHAEGLELVVEYLGSEGRDFRFDVVIRIRKDRDQVGPFRVHLHPTYPRRIITLTKVWNDGTAKLADVRAQGVYTIGVQVFKRGVWIPLEYDLADTPGLPRRFLPRTKHPVPRRWAPVISVLSATGAPSSEDKNLRGGSFSGELAFRLESSEPALLYQVGLALVNGQGLWASRTDLVLKVAEPDSARVRYDTRALIGETLLEPLQIGRPGPLVLLSAIFRPRLPEQYPWQWDSDVPPLTFVLTGEVHAEDGGEVLKFDRYFRYVEGSKVESVDHIPSPPRLNDQELAMLVNQGFLSEDEREELGTASEEARYLLATARDYDPSYVSERAKGLVRELQIRLRAGIPTVDPAAGEDLVIEHKVKVQASQVVLQRTPRADSVRVTYEGMALRVGATADRVVTLDDIPSEFEGPVKCTYFAARKPSAAAW